MASYLWGKASGLWHALARHDPEYIHEEKYSEKLKKNVKVVKGTKPGHGNTLCGLVKKPLDGLGVDPEEGDLLCPSCQELAAN